MSNRHKTTVKLSFAKKSYLFSYNLFMLLCYGLLFPQLIKSLSKPTSFNLISFVGSSYRVLIIFSSLEILHPILGLVRGNFVFPFIQIGFKSLVYFAFVENSPFVQTYVSVRVLLITWTLAEMIRYPFYVLSVLNIQSYPITWLRYTAWIVLYPIGIFTEAVVIYQNLPHLQNTGRYNYEMPNQLNVSFYGPYAIFVYLYVGIWSGSYFMLSHMARQRRKVLYGL